MPAVKKTADAAPAVEAEESGPAPAQAAGPETPAAEEAPAPAAPVEAEFRPAVMVRFTGQAESAVSPVGLCAPGVEYPVPAAVADDLCRGGGAQFVRVEAA